MVIDGYLWLSMVISVYLNSAMVILVIVVISGYLWLLVTLRSIFQDNGYHGY